jgi:type I restriction enzyme S subunit
MGADCLETHTDLWQRFRLDHVATIMDSLHKTPTYAATGFPMVRVTDVKGGFLDLTSALRVNEDVFEEFTRRHTPRRGDIVFSRVGTYGNASYVATDSPFCLGQNTALIHPKIDSRFLHFWLQSSVAREQIEHAVVGSTQKTISLKSIAALEILLPSTDEQRAIADILGTLDDKIEVNRRMNQTLEAMARALFQSWFVDFEPVHRNIQRAQGHTPPNPHLAEFDALFPDAFEDSELGMIPKGWRVQASDSIFEIGIGKTPPRKEQQWFSTSPNDVPWISIRDMGNSGVFIAQTNEFLTSEAVEKFRVKRIPDGTVVLSFKLTVGRVAITDGEMLSNEAIAHFRPRAGVGLSSEFLYCYLSQFRFDSLGSSSSIATAVNSDSIRAIPLLAPAPVVADQFHSLTAPIFAKMKLVQREASTLAALRDTLLPKLISGELWVKDAEKFVEGVV